MPQRKYPKRSAGTASEKVAKKVKRKRPANALPPHVVGPFKITGDNIPAQLKGKGYYIDETKKMHLIVLLGPPNKLTDWGWISRPPSSSKWKAHPNSKRRPPMSFTTRNEAALYLVGARTYPASIKPKPKTKPVGKRALAPVIKIFNTLRDDAAKTHPQIKTAGLGVDSSIHKTPRDYGMAALNKAGPMVYVAPELAQQPTSVIKGVLAHELGHVAAWLGPYPVPKGYDATERQADKIAEELFGLKLYYNKANVQCMGPGAKGTRPRPRGLK